MSGSRADISSDIKIPVKSLSILVAPNIYG